MKGCFKMKGKQRIIMPKKGDFVKFQNYDRKIKSPFLICANFEKILVPDKNKGKIQRALYKQISKNKLNYKILIVFHKLKKYDPHLIIMQELGKFNLKQVLYQMD